MPTEEKIQAVKEIQEMLDGATIVISTSYARLPVSQMTILRHALREKGVRFKVVKNTLAYLAADAAGQPAIKEVIKGPSGVAFGYGEVTAPAKALSDFIRVNRSPMTIQGAVMDGRALTAAQVEQLATLPSKEEIIARLLGQMQAPISGLLYVLNGPIAGLARVLQGHVENLQKQEQPTG